jgi:hypothetical protein
MTDLGRTTREDWHSGAVYWQHRAEKAEALLRQIRDGKHSSEIIETLMNSQAELQSALGIYRMGRGGRGFDPYVERRMQASLAMQHELLDSLGHPMYHPTQMPEDWTPA